MILPVQGATAALSDVTVMREYTSHGTSWLIIQESIFWNILNIYSIFFTVDFGVSAQLDRTVGRRNTFIGTPYW